MTARTEPSPGLWAWAAAAYGRNGVAEACLVLQDQHGQCVPFLLWAVWAGGRGADLLDKAAAIARAWDRDVVQPLRAVRRASKAQFIGIDDAARSAWRDRLKADELAAERLLLVALEALVSPGDDQPISPHEALNAAIRTWGGDPAASEAIERLAGAFSSR